MMSGTFSDNVRGSRAENVKSTRTLSFVRPHQFNHEIVCSRSSAVGRVGHELCGLHET